MTNEQLIADVEKAGAIKKYQDLTAFKKAEVTYFEITLENLVAFSAIRDARKDAEIARLRDSYSSTLAVALEALAWSDGHLNSKLVQRAIACVQQALAQGEQNE
jgi:hypothetical protein